MAKKEDNLSTTLHLHSNHARNIRSKLTVQSHNLGDADPHLPKGSDAHDQS